MPCTESCRELLKAMQAVHAGIVLKRSGENDYFKSTYVELSDVLQALRQPCLDHGLLCNFAVCPCEVLVPGSADGSKPALLGQTVELTVTHLATGEIVGYRLTIPLPEPNAHAIGSAIRYARRYLLILAFNLQDRDDDGNEACRLSLRPPPLPPKEKSLFRPPQTPVPERPPPGPTPEPPPQPPQPQQATAKVPPARLPKRPASPAPSTTKAPSKAVLDALRDVNENNPDQQKMFPGG